MIQQLPESTDVLIVGAGPVGLTLATALARAGIAAVLIDKSAEAANTSRAAVVHARTLEALDEVDATAELISRGIVAPRISVHDHDRTLLRVEFSALPTAYPYALLVPQDITEEVLTDRLRSAGGDVHRSRELVGLEQHSEGVTATMADGAELTARYVVGADGMHSKVRELAGIGFTGDTYAQSFVLADVHLDWAEPDDEVMLFFAPEGVTVVAPLPGGRHRIVATVAEAPEQPDAQDVQSLLTARGPRERPANIRDVVWSSRFRVHHMLADRYRTGRLLLAGDAAHVHSPAGGQGMNTGIQDAVNLAAKLAAVIRDGAGETTLDRYEAERRPIAEEVVAFTHRMTRAATVSRQPARGARNLALRTLNRVPAVRRAFAMTLSELASDPARAGAHGASVGAGV